MTATATTIPAEKKERLLSLREAIIGFHSAAFAASKDLGSPARVKCMSDARPILELAEYHVSVSLGEPDPKIKDLEPKPALPSGPATDHYWEQDQQARLEILLNEAYVFLGMPNKALQPWRQSLGEWQERVEDETGWKHYDEVQKYDKAPKRFEELPEPEEEDTSTPEQRLVRLREATEVLIAAIATAREHLGSDTQRTMLDESKPVLETTLHNIELSLTEYAWRRSRR